MKNLLNIKISAIAFTKNNFKKHINLWKRFEVDEFQMIYATLKILLKHRNHFLLDIIRSHCSFIKNLIAIAIDECHLVWDWEDFRREYDDIEKLRSLLNRVSFIYLSATLTSNIIVYVHEICRLSYFIIRFNLLIWWDNINLIVSKIDHLDINQLFNWISKFHLDNNHKIIRKTLIFYDKINLNIDIINEFITQLS